MLTNKTLAIHGGVPVFPKGEPTWPRQQASIRQMLQAAWEDGSWGRYHGPYNERLTARLREVFHVGFVRLTSSGTIAVELALRGVGVRSGQNVVLAGYDFPGNFRAIESMGARPLLIDIDGSYSLSESGLQDALGLEDIGAVLISHLHGGLANMPEVIRMARKRGVPVVEDACQCPGAVVEGRPAGSWGDAGVLSFGGSKLLTAGRGGALLTNDPSVLQRCTIFADRGNDAFPLSELQAAVLIPQLDTLKADNDLRRERVVQLRQLLAGNRTLHVIGDTPWGTASYYKVALRFVSDASSWSRAGMIHALQAEGVGVGPGFRGFALRSKRRCTKVGSLLESRAAAENVMLLHHPILGAPCEAIDRLAFAMEKVCASNPEP